MAAEEKVVEEEGRVEAPRQEALASLVVRLPGLEAGAVQQWYPLGHLLVARWVVDPE